MRNPGEHFIIGWVATLHHQNQSSRKGRIGSRTEAPHGWHRILISGRASCVGRNQVTYWNLIPIHELLPSNPSLSRNHVWWSRVATHSSACFGTCGWGPTEYHACLTGCGCGCIWCSPSVYTSNMWLRQACSSQAHTVGPSLTLVGKMGHAGVFHWRSQFVISENWLELLG